MTLPFKTLMLTVKSIAELEAILLAVKKILAEPKDPTMKTSVGGCIEQKN
jgi:hypothetical protein